MLAKLLTELLKRNNFNWTSTSTDVSNKPKEVMSLSPLLALPNFEAEFVIEIDTCEEGVGAVLMQEGRPSAYMSKTSSDRHRLLSVYKEKMLAIVMAIQKWRQYLLGKHFKIKSDHQGLKSLLQQRITAPTQQKWLVKLMGYDLEVVYKKVAYHIQLPLGARIHNVFRVSQLKRKVGTQKVTAIWPQSMNEAGEKLKNPAVILDHQLIKRSNKAGVKVLTQWSNSPSEETTWEFHDILLKKFPKFCFFKSLRTRINSREGYCCNLEI